MFLNVIVNLKFVQRREFRAKRLNQINQSKRKFQEKKPLLHSNNNTVSL